MNKYTRLFIDESREYLPAIATIVSRLRDGSSAGEDLKEGQRLAHSIKGMALYEEQPAIASLSWAMERGFERLQAGAHPDGLVPSIERGVPLLIVLVDEVEDSGSTSTDPGEVVAAIEAALAL